MTGSDRSPSDVPPVGLRAWVGAGLWTRRSASDQIEVLRYPAPARTQTPYLDGCHRLLIQIPDRQRAATSFCAILIDQSTVRDDGRVIRWLGGVALVLLVTACATTTDAPTTTETLPTTRETSPSADPSPASADHTFNVF